VVGWVADRFGPRWALGVGAASGFAAVLVGLLYLVKYRQLRVYREGGRLRYSVDDPRQAPAYISPAVAVQDAVLSEAEEDSSAGV
jgi:hypothetical protein